MTGHYCSHEKDRGPVKCVTELDQQRLQQVADARDCIERLKCRPHAIQGRERQRSSSALVLHFGLEPLVRVVRCAYLLGGGLDSGAAPLDLGRGVARRSLRMFQRRCERHPLVCSRGEAGPIVSTVVFMAT